jgi:hypothetical protein
MSLTANVVLDIYATLLLLVPLGYSAGGGSRASSQHKVYLAMLLTTIFLLVFDIIARFDGLEYPLLPALNWWGNLILFLVTPLLPSLWVLYVYLQAGGGNPVPRNALLGVMLINAVNILLVIASLFTGWFYTIDQANVYHRGPFYPYHHMVTLVMLVWAFVVIYKNRRNFERRVRFSLFFFPIPSLLGGVLQVVFYSYAFALAASVPRF